MLEQKTTKTVIATCFFNLKKLPDAVNNDRTLDFYMEKCIPTMSAQADMVVFCDKETKPLIEEKRSSSQYKTIYVEKNIAEYDFFKSCYPIIAENRKNSRGYKDPNNRNTVSLFLTWIFKVIAIQETAKSFPDATHYAWIDFGCSHVVRNVAQNLFNVINYPQPKLAMTYIHYRPNNSIANVESYMEFGNNCGIAATTFTVEKYYVNLLYTRFMSIFYEHLSKGVGHSDEAIFTYMYDRFPDMFTLRFGDYYSVLSNYTNIKEDYPAIRNFFINEAIRAGRIDLAKVAAQEVIFSVENNLLEIDSNELSFLRKLI